MMKNNKTVDNKKITKAFILAGGRGTRLAEQTSSIPKPLVTIGDIPVIVHVMRTFYRQGIREFYLLCGYKEAAFKEFFNNYMLNGNNMVFTKYGKMSIDNNSNVEDWSVHIINTGVDSSTGQRVDYIRRYLDDGEPFFLTYGDSVSDVNVKDIEAVHFNAPENNVVTITAINRGERFGILKTGENNKVLNFAEKSDNAEELINGGYIACNYELLDYVDGDSDDLSFSILTKLAKEGKMSYYHYSGFWHAMDTQKDVEDLNELYENRPELFSRKV